MANCRGHKRSGERCTVAVESPQEFCWWHDPDHAEQRSQAASKAARSKVGVEVREVTRKLGKLADDVLEGTVDKATGAVVAQILGVLIRGLEQERKQREQEQLIERIEQLEAQDNNQKGGSYRWG